MERREVNLWGWLQTRLIDMAYYNLKGECHEADLLVAIIISGAKEGDWEYFDTWAFKLHCHWLSFIPHHITRILTGFQYYIDNGYDIEDLEENFEDYLGDEEE